MASTSTADADGTTRPGGARARVPTAGRPITLWFVAGVFGLSGGTYLLTGGSSVHATGGMASGLTGIVLLAIAGGLWYRQKWAIVVAVVLQALGLVLAFLTIDLPGVVISIVLLGAMFAIPHRVWH